MRTIKSQAVTDAVKKLCLKANLELRPDVLKALQAALRREKSPRVKRCLSAIVDNAAAARRKRIAICQDTGLPSVFVEAGQDVRIVGDLSRAVQDGIREGYKTGFFRTSIVADPLKRGKPSFAPGVLHTAIARGDRVKITLLAKGFGCENKGALKMLNPTAGISEVKRFVVDTVRRAGADACPPYIVGIGIGGTADHACLMAKRVLLRGLQSSSSALERDLLREINGLKIGPMGFGGQTTALRVLVETAPTHIAGLPVAVSISCHALRSAALTL